MCFSSPDEIDDIVIDWIGDRILSGNGGKVSSTDHVPDQESFACQRPVFASRTLVQSIVAVLYPIAH